MEALRPDSFHEKHHPKERGLGLVFILLSIATTKSKLRAFLLHETSSGTGIEGLNVPPIYIYIYIYIYTHAYVYILIVFCVGGSKDSTVL